jgi:cytoskeletal protein RodZ
MPAYPADGDTSWGAGDWAAEVDNRVRANGTAATPTVRTLGTGASEAAAGNHTHSTTAASETVQGIVELATAAETTTGTDNTRAVHPAGLKVELDKKQATTTTQTTQTGATYTFVLGDSGTVVEGNSASAQTFTVPPNASVAFAVGASIVVRQYGAGQITMAPGAAVTLRSRGAALKTAGQYAELVATKRATDEWVISGDVTV